MSAGKSARSRSEQATATSAAESTLFLRKATGLVRSWSVFDAFVYAFFSINLVTLGFYIISQMWFFEGGLIPALIISGVIILAECVVYAGLIAVMPRAGGDYVWQSRILGGGVGFVLAITGWWFILWLWTPIYADMLRQIFFVPLLGVIGAKDAALWFAWDPTAYFLVCVLTVVFVAAVIALGMKTYARVQKFCFWIGNAGLLVVCLFLLFGSNAGFKAGLEANATQMFGAAPGVYDATIKAGQAAGAITPLFGGSLVSIFLLMPYLTFFNLWPNWGATLYGEVKGADDFKKNFWGMALALIVTTALAVVFFLLVDKTISWDFLNNANAAYWSYRWGFSTDSPAAECLALPGNAGDVPDNQPDPTVRSHAGDEHVVLRLGRDGLPLLDARDLRRRLRSATAGGRRADQPTHAHADLGAGADGRAWADRVGAVRLQRSAVRQPVPEHHAGLDAGDRQ